MRVGVRELDESPLTAALIARGASKEPSASLAEHFAVPALTLTRSAPSTQATVTAPVPKIVAFDLSESGGSVFMNVVLVNVSSNLPKPALAAPCLHAGRRTRQERRAIAGGPEVVGRKEGDRRGRARERKRPRVEALVLFAAHSVVRERIQRALLTRRAAFRACLGTFRHACFVERTRLVGRAPGARARFADRNVGDVTSRNHMRAGGSLRRARNERDGDDGIRFAGPERDSPSCTVPRGWGAVVPSVSWGSSRRKAWSSGDGAGSTVFADVAQATVPHDTSLRRIKKGTAHLDVHATENRFIFRKTLRLYVSQQPATFRGVAAPAAAMWPPSTRVRPAPDASPGVVYINSMKRFSALLAVLSAAFAASTVSCTNSGARSGYLDEKSTTSDPNGGPATGSLGPVTDSGVTPPQNGCSAAAQLVYVVSAENDLYSFKPDKLAFVRIGTLNCQSSSSPNSMAVDRSGTAWVNFSDGSLFKVSTSDASCQTTGFQVGQSGFSRFGMAFSTNSATTEDETLYVSDISDVAPGRGLAKIDTGTFKLTTIGKFSGPLSDLGGELTGTGDGRLFGFFTTKPNATLAQIDGMSAATSGTKDLLGVSTGQAFAFSFWGGDFWFYTSSGGSPSSVTKLAASGDNSLSVVMSNVGNFRIVGAGVSTCAPTTPPH